MKAWVMIVELTTDLILRTYSIYHFYKHLHIMRWLPYPFVRISFFFVAGVLLGIYFPAKFSMLNGIACLAVCFVLYVVLALRKTPGRDVITGILGLFIIFMLGYVRSINFNDSQSKNHLINVKGQVEFYTAVIDNCPEEKEKFWKVEAQLGKIQMAGKWSLATGKIQLYFLKKDFPTCYQYGDKLLVKGAPLIVPPPANPGEFDYKRFLKFKNIYHQHFLKKHDVKFIDHQNTNIFLSWSFTARRWANGVFIKYIQTKQERAIASALVLGVNDGLDRDLLSAYTSTGTLHVLSVSGLHVSIIYLIIVTLFKPVCKFSVGKSILAFSAIFILWAYAFVTGLSPSVLRAVTMFSFVALSHLLSRNTNIYNTLSMSAFCLLLYDPFMIMSVGFQLSYLAVVGIVYLQPPIYQWWAPNSRILDEVWKITSVSIAAQLATFGLGLLYFNQFPNYFLLSNLFVIPGSFVVLISGLALLVFDVIQPLAFCIGIFMEWTIRIMNYIVFTIEELPFSLVENVYISAYQYWLLTGALLSAIVFIKLKRYSYLLSGLVMLILFSVLQWGYYSKSFCRQRITFYSISHHSAIDLLDRGRAYFMMDSALLSNAMAIKFHITPNRLLNGITEVENIVDKGLVRTLRGARLIFWREKAILQITNANFSMPVSLHVDYVLISNNTRVDLVTIKKCITFRKLIIDSSNSFYFAGNLLAQAMKQQIDVHSTQHSGALVVNI